MTSRALALAAAAGSTAALLAGCGHGRWLKLTAEEADVPSCGNIPEDEVVILVEDLDGPKRPDCDPKPASFEFPDGTRVPMDAHAGAAATSGTGSAYEYAVSDAGVYGFVAERYRADDCSDLTIWGPAEAIEKLDDAFGERPWSCAGTSE